MSSLKPVRIPPVLPSVRCRSWKAHNKFIQGLVLSPDGKHLFTSSEDGGLCCWDLASGEKVREYTGHRGPVNHLALTPDGARMVSAGDDKTLRVWDVETAKSLRILKGHTDYVSKVAVAVQGERLIAVSSSKDTTLRVWDLETLQCIHVLTGHTEWASSLGVSADGTRAVSGSPAREMKVWDLVNGTELPPLMSPGDTTVHWGGKRSTRFLRRGTGEGPGHTGDPEAMVFFDNDTRLLSVEEEILVWDLEARTCQAFAQDSHLTFGDLARLSDGRVIVAGYSLEVWDLQTGQRLVMRPQSTNIRSMTLSADEQSLITANEKGEIVIWDVEELLEAGKPEGHFNYINSLLITGDRLLTAGWDRQLIQWDLNTGLPTRARVLNSGSVSLPMLLRDGERYISINTGGLNLRDKHLSLWHIDQDEPLQTITLLGSPYVTQLSPDEKTVCCSTHNGVYSINLESGEITEWTGKVSKATSAVWTSDGEWVITSNHHLSPSVLPLWSVKKGARTKTCTVGKANGSGGSLCVTLSADEQTIIAGWENSSVYTWNRKNRKLLHFWDTGHQRLKGLFVESTGNLLTHSDNGPLKRWDLSGNLLAEIPTPWQRTWRMTFSPDHSHVVGIEKGRVWVIRLSDGELCASLVLPEDADAYQAAVSNDGQTVVVGLKRGSPLIYRPA